MPDAPLRDVLARHSREQQLFDMGALRRDCVRWEVKVADGELRHVYDHFEPGVAEVAAVAAPTGHPVRTGAGPDRALACGKKVIGHNCLPQ